MGLHPGDTQLPGAGRSRSPHATGLLLGLVLLIAAVALSLAVGTERIPPGDVWSGLFSPSGSRLDTIVRELRLPRTLIGIAVGTALGLAGGVMQVLTRKSARRPRTARGERGCVGRRRHRDQHVRHHVVHRISVVRPLAGAAVAAVAVHALGGSRSATPVRLALAGTAVNAALFGYVNGLQLWDLSTLDSMRYWSVGTLAKRDPELLLAALPACCSSRSAGSRPASGTVICPPSAGSSLRSSP